MNEDENPQRDSQAQPQAQAQAHPETTPTEPDAPMPSKDAGWAGASPTQVMRTVAVALLSAAVVLGAFLLLWQVRTFIGWFVIALFLAAVLNPAVNWLQRRHRFIKRPLAIGLTYLGVVVALLFVVGIFLPLLVDQINGLTKFVSAAAQAPEGPTEYIKGLAKQRTRRAPTQVQHRTRRSQEAAGGCAKEPLLLHRSYSRWCGRVHRRAGDRPDAHLLPDPGQRALRERRGRALPRGAPAAGAAPARAVSGGDQRLHHRQPGHQRNLWCNHLHCLADPRYALCCPAGATGCGARPHTPGRRYARRSVAHRCGLVRRAVEGRCAAHLRAGLPAGGEQFPPTDSLQQSRPAQRVGDPHRAAGRWATTRHPRGVAGNTCGRDHPYSRNRTTSLPAHEARREGARRCVFVAAC